MTRVLVLPTSERFGLDVNSLQARAGELQGTALTRLALQTLGGFDFGPARLLEFVRNHVMAYLDDADVSIRRAAALASTQVLQGHVASQPGKNAASHIQVIPLQHARRKPETCLGSTHGRHICFSQRGS